MFNVYIFDDNEMNGAYISRLFASYQKRSGRFDKSKVHCVSSNFIAFVDSIPVTNHNNHIYIIDISLGDGESGLQLAKRIRTIDILGYIIFYTSHLEWVTMAYNYNVKAINYLYKLDPNIKVKFEGTLEQIHNEYEMSAMKPIDSVKSEVITFLYNSQHYKIECRNIQYIETNTSKRCLNIKCDSGVMIYPKSMKTILAELPQYFVKCHKSYIINTRRIKGLMAESNSYAAVLDNEERCYVSRKYFDKVLEWFEGRAI